ncbi:MAG: hypothetical protein COB35_13710 [Gammaproteobacteria bacterium]|nr:MAG: hypothetical protein COB35_13710 [Gammaproteobacteria bacterium]
MLGSLILSMAMSATPAPVVDTNTFSVKEVARPRGRIRIDMQKLDVQEVARPRGRIRIDAQKLDVQEVARPRGRIKF